MSPIILDEQIIRTSTARVGCIRIRNCVFCVRGYALVLIPTFRGIYYGDSSITQNKGEVSSGERKILPFGSQSGVHDGSVGVINTVICCNRGGQTQCSEAVNREYVRERGPHVKAKETWNSQQDQQALYENLCRPGS